MRRITRPIFYMASLILCSVVIITCIKVEKVVMVSTGGVKNVQTNSATAEGTIVDIGVGVSDHGHVYSTSKDVTISSGTKVAHGSKGSTGTFNSELTNLTAGTTYYIKAYVMGNGGTQLGKEVTFKTADPVVPVLTTSAITAVATTSATSGGNISADGGAPVTARGVCWGTSSGPTVNSSKTTDGTGTGSFGSSLINLTPGTAYFVRAYATNAAGTGYGNELTFTTVSIVPPVVETTTTNVFSSTLAECGGNVISDGGGSITSKGVCWSTAANPTISDQFTNEGTGGGNFMSTITNLTRATLYHVRAYATNAAGTAYGEDKTFSTLAELPVVTTAAISANTSTSATSGGEVVSDGGAPVTERGVCWSLVANPSILDSKTTNSSGIGTFTSSITGLNPSTTYHVRAYATNSVGTAYGDDLTFNTSNPVYPPTVLTATVSPFTTTTAVSGGNVQDGGGSTVEMKGVCWSTTLNPTITDQKTNEGAGLGTFVSNLTGLTPGTTYYVRAYATNAAGLTGYGTNATFTTNAVVLPVVTTKDASAIASTGVYTGGEVTNEGSASVTLRGLVYGIASGPTIADLKVDAGSGLGAFSIILKNLSPNTTYHARAFATSSEGTSYGNEISFTTTIQVTDVDGNIYNTVIIGSQLWMQENLKVTKFRNGTSIKYLEDNTAWSTQTSGAYCWYDNDVATNKDSYGALYNYYTTIQNLYLCPTGWRVPTNADWSVLETFLGGNTVAGGKLKETGTGHWTTPNAQATNETGFFALPGGLRMDDGTYASKTTNGYWWYSTESTPATANRKDIAYNAGGFYVMTVSKNYGVSVRCLQGEGKVLPTVTTTGITNPTTTSATSGGNITSDGGAAITARGVCWSTTQGPTVDLATKTSDGTGSGSYPSSISGLTANTKYYVRAYATNSVGTSYGDEVSFTTDPLTVGDIDGITYNVIRIGTQLWMKENLETTKYSNGDPIGTTTPATLDITGETTPKYQWAYDGNEANVAFYGRLYTWYAATDSRNVCPTGWHVPSDAEWTVLENYLITNAFNYDGTTTGNKIAKALASTTLWNSSAITGAVGNTDYPAKRNASGFTAIPSGFRDFSGPFVQMDISNFYWTAIESSLANAWLRSIYYNNTILDRANYNKKDGYSVRCLRD